MSYTEAMSEKLCQQDVEELALMKLRRDALIWVHDDAIDDMDYLDGSSYLRGSCVR